MSISKSHYDSACGLSTKFHMSNQSIAAELGMTRQEVDKLISKTLLKLKRRNKHLQEYLYDSPNEEGNSIISNIASIDLRDSGYDSSGESPEIPT